MPPSYPPMPASYVQEPPRESRCQKVVQNLIQKTQLLLSPMACGAKGSTAQPMPM